MYKESSMTIRCEPGQDRPSTLQRMRSRPIALASDDRAGADAWIGFQSDRHMSFRATLRSRPGGCRLTRFTATHPS